MVRSGHTLVRRPDRREELLGAIHNEYRHLPGLSLTTPQACRLFDLDPGTCASLLGCLVDEGILARTPAGAFVARPTPTHLGGR